MQTSSRAGPALQLRSSSWKPSRQCTIGSKASQAQPCRTASPVRVNIVRADEGSRALAPAARDLLHLEPTVRRAFHPTLGISCSILTFLISQRDGGRRRRRQAAAVRQHVRRECDRGVHGRGACQGAATRASLTSERAIAIAIAIASTRAGLDAAAGHGQGAPAAAARRQQVQVSVGGARIAPPRPAHTHDTIAMRARPRA